MPTYDYSCSSCGEKLEVFQKISDEPLVLCPKCNKSTLKRGIGGGSALFCFKGKGFYITDYGSKSSCGGDDCSCCKKK